MLSTGKLMFVFVGVLLSMVSRAHGQVNVFCMMEHCAETAKNCMEDHNCRAALSCLTGCGTSNSTCMFRCIYSFEDPVFDDFMKCAITEHKCIQMKSPNPNFRCNWPPSEYILRNLSTEQLVGQWYIVKGLNRNFDCFDCQRTTFSQTGQPSVYNVTENFDVLSIEGKTIHRTVVESATQNGTLKGVLSYKSIQMGHETTTDWQMLYVDDRIMIGYYCGHVASDWYYEGSNVFSKDSVLDERKQLFIKQKLNALGFDYSKYCTPSYSNCS